MTFVLCGLGSTPLIEISKDMEDYVEFEETMFHFGMRHLAFPIIDHVAFHAMRNVIDRRILHLLATARLYRNALKRHRKSLLTESASITKLDALLTDSPSQPMSYRIVEALRNYAQHNEFPVASMGASWRLDIDKAKAFDDAAVAKARSSHSIIAKIDAKKISGERDIAPEVRDALSGLGDKVEIVDHLRVYIEHLGGIHATFRELVKSNEREWEETIRSALADYFKALKNKEKPPVVYAARIDQGKRYDQVQLFEEFFDTHVALRRKNLVNRYLSKSYVKWPGRYD